MFLVQMRSKLSENPWQPVNIETMDACKFTFADNTFDPSLTKFVFAGLSGDIGAASHIMRTLKPGGTEVIAIWAEMPRHIALEIHITKRVGLRSQWLLFSARFGTRRTELSRLPNMLAEKMSSSYRRKPT
jgi:ubiquinone/menaquinone biosynthesis C-methylase UbiE